MAESRIEGGCNCGAVRYVLTAEPQVVAACHCSNCRRQSGAAFSVNLVVPLDAMEVTGELASYADHDTASGKTVHRQYCGSCGSPIRSLLDSAPEIAAVKAGTADEPGRFAPAVHVWTSSALPWVHIPDNLPQFPRNP